ncbi:unnamed protein product [Adineta steineri]|uniref:F-box domain-containing protein n=1 Tax=Adineta steineri TaxID=433720 RepID=A0A815V863_9BILA|nr:unnamed protein product [Adineta steineri]CAF1525870.1 unnamed protein product [Adineta steineri]
MLNRNPSCIEDLANELWLEIFDYLDWINLYSAFYGINKRINQLLEYTLLMFYNVHDHFIGIRRFTLKDKPIPFVKNNDNSLIYPQRILASTHDVIDCHTSTPTDEATLSNTLNKISNNIQMFNTKIDAIQRQIFEQAEYPIPHLFIVLPEETSFNPSTWFCHTYRLHFLCDCENENERHFALHDGYKISKPHEFFRKYGPYLRHILTVIKGMACVGSIVLPQLSSIHMGLSNFTALQKKEFCNSIIDKAERAGEILTKVEECLNISTEAIIQEVDGATLRQIRRYLEKVDNHDTLRNVYRSITSDGHVRWVCVKHRNRPYLNANIQQLDGKIKEDVALVKKLHKDKFEKFIKLLHQGLTFSTIKTNSRLIFKIRPAEVTSSLELTGTNEAGFTLSIKSDDETDAVKYSSAINNMFEELNIATLHLHNAILSESLWNTIRQLVVDSQNLEEMIMDCPSTLNETQEWIFSLCKNESLKVLHTMNGPKQANVCVEIFQMLKEKDTLEKFSLTSSTYRLQLDFISASSQNRYSTLIRIAKWCTNNNSDVLIIKKFLQIIPVHHLSLDLANINCETSLTQLPETINQLPLLKTLELQSKTSCAVFHREKRIFNRESSEESSNPRLQISNERAMPIEPFSHISSNPLYKQIQEIALNFTLKQFQITISPDVNISHIASSIQSNSTVTHLRFVGRIEETDMTTLIKAFRKNTIISHLSLKEIEISLLNLRQILDMSYVNRRLRVLEIHHCTSDFDRKLFQQEIKQSRSENRALQIFV